MPSTPRDDNKSPMGGLGGTGQETSAPEVGDNPSPEDLAARWLASMPKDQFAVWAGMSQVHRALAVKRLASVLAYEAGGARNASKYVDVEELSLPRFHSILRAWRLEKSLFALVPQARRRAPRAFTPPAGIEDAAIEMVQERPDSSLEAIAKALHERFDQPSLSWKRRLVARVRRDFERELAGGRNGFASRVVVDSAALPLPLLPADYDTATVLHDGDQDVEYDWAVSAFVWDAATGVVLGHAMNRAPANMHLHASAARAASAVLRGMPAEATTADKGTVPVIVTTLPLEEERDVVETLRLIRMLQSDGAKVIHSPRAAGSELMKAFEGRIGQLDLRPRFALDVFAGRSSRADALAKSGRDPLTLADARLILEHAITEHNNTISKTDANPAVTPSSVADSLDRIFQQYLSR